MLLLREKKYACGIEKYLKCNKKYESCVSWVELCNLGRFVRVGSICASWVDLCEFGRFVRVGSICASWVDLCELGRVVRVVRVESSVRVGSSYVNWV